MKDLDKFLVSFVLNIYFYFVCFYSFIIEPEGAERLSKLNRLLGLCFQKATGESD